MTIKSNITNDYEREEYCNCLNRFINYLFNMDLRNLRC